MTTAIAPYNPAMPIRVPGNALSMFQQRAGELQSILPEGAALTVAMVVDSAMALLSAPDRGGEALRNCTGESIYESVKAAASFGLSFHKVLNLAHLVPFKNTCTLIVGFGGLLDLVQRACELKSVDANVVYQGDEIDITLSPPDVKHRPSLTTPRSPEKIIGAYFVAVLPSGLKHVEWMSRAEIDGIRRRSRASSSGPWVTDYAEMARKTVVRRGQKMLPKSISKAAILLAKAAETDDAITGIDEQELPATPADRTEAFLAKLRGEQPPGVVDAAPEPAPSPDLDAAKRELFTHIQELRAGSGSSMSDREFVGVILARIGLVKVESIEDCARLRAAVDASDPATGELVP